jgi:two-component system, chemotaxis family, response regulator PixG
MTSSASLLTIPAALKILEDFANKQASGCLRCTANGVVWYLYLSRGKVVYVNFSIDPLDRLELYIRRTLGRRDFDWPIFNVWRQRVAIAKLDEFYPSYDYQLINSLVRKNRLTAQDAIAVIQGISNEAFRNLMLVSQLEWGFTADEREFPILWSINFLSLAKDCQDEIQQWQALGAGISSPYQRLFVVKKKEPTLQLKNIQHLLTGTDFHHLALSFRKSPLEVARQILPLLEQGLIGLRAPKVPFSKVPHFVQPQENSFGEIADISSGTNTKLQYRVACIDDSPTILQRMRLFLDRKVFEIFSILDSGTALTQIITIQPHVILLDITMPHIDGYKLCSMIRRHKDFKETPIIMVTSNTGFFDRTRAKFCGATDYLTKPFTQENLSEMVHKYLVD